MEGTTLGLEQLTETHTKIFVDPNGFPTGDFISPRFSKIPIRRSVSVEETTLGLEQLTETHTMIFVDPNGFPIGDFISPLFSNF